jgi:hypothetical protein
MKFADILSTVTVTAAQSVYYDIYNVILSAAAGFKLGTCRH